MKSQCRLLIRRGKYMWFISVLESNLIQKLDLLSFIIYLPLTRVASEVQGLRGVGCKNASLYILSLQKGLQMGFSLQKCPNTQFFSIFEFLMWGPIFQDKKIIPKLSLKYQWAWEMVTFLMNVLHFKCQTLRSFIWTI